MEEVFAETTRSIIDFAMGHLGLYANLFAGLALAAEIAAMLWRKDGYSHPPDIFEGYDDDEEGYRNGRRWRY